MQKSRRELIEWIRSLGIEISAIEELGKGTAICEVLSAMHPEFPPSFVRNPCAEHEYLKNMKICQDFFNSRDIKLYFPVEKLIKCKMQDNLEIAQWLAKQYSRGVQERRSPRREEKRTSAADVIKRKEERIEELEDTVRRMQTQIAQMETNEGRLAEQVSRLRHETGSLGDQNVRSLLMTFEKERDLYFKKLFMIEKYFLETDVDSSTKKDMLEILYEDGE